MPVQAISKRAPVGQNEVQVIRIDEAIVVGRIQGRPDADSCCPCAQQCVQVVDVHGAVTVDITRQRRHRARIKAFDGCGGARGGHASDHIDVLIVAQCDPEVVPSGLQRRTDRP